MSDILNKKLSLIHSILSIVPCIVFEKFWIILVLIKSVADAFYQILFPRYCSRELGLFSIDDLDISNLFHLKRSKASIRGQSWEEKERKALDFVFIPLYKLRSRQSCCLRKPIPFLLTLTQNHFDQTYCTRLYFRKRRSSSAVKLQSLNTRGCFRIIFIFPKYCFQKAHLKHSQTTIFWCLRSWTNEGTNSAHWSWR